MVVVEERQWLPGLIRSTNPEVGRLADQIPVNFQLSRSAARALATYVQRRETIFWGRRREIARPLGEPLRERLDLPANTDLDLLLCALYHRTFITDRHDWHIGETSSPFMQPNAAFPQVVDPKTGNSAVTGSTAVGSMAANATATEPTPDAQIQPVADNEVSDVATND
jgi:hypothetical protein